ncbi:hypothetical protein L596_026155 [Steinernema carpocapsae]|uniref:7TM GPCR serpentine receptor class x (Srx) domain-containing protein n=1 Tax=Steinernema carpocapsae TaxID=34508 RepID=A0A4U5M0J7_STECR|nr:hypothetical protein L596_026155 [Steinernema carpocapsae]
MSINRFVCMYFHFRYAQIFSDFVTKAGIFLIWLIAILISTLQFLPDCECFVWIDNFNYEWYINECGLILGLYGDFALSVAGICLVALLDFLTYLKVRKYNSLQHRNSVGSTNDASSKSNIRFFYQSAAQGLAAVLEIITYFYVSPTFNNKWMRFFCSAFLFLAVNLVDAVIVTMFNKEIRNVIWKTKAIPSVMPQQTVSDIQGTVDGQS